MLVEQRGLQNGADGAALTGALDLGPGAGSDQTAWALDDTVYAGNMPYFRLVMTETERALIDDLAHT